jgi:hypothetical protein
MSQGGRSLLSGISTYKISWLFSSYFLAVQGLKLRAYWTIPSVIFLFSFFWDRISHFTQAGLRSWTSYLLFPHSWDYRCWLPLLVCLFIYLFICHSTNLYSVPTILRPMWRWHYVKTIETLWKCWGWAPEWNEWNSASLGGFPRRGEGWPRFLRKEKINGFVERGRGTFWGHDQQVCLTSKENLVNAKQDGEIEGWKD